MKYLLRNDDAAKAQGQVTLWKIRKYKSIELIIQITPQVMETTSISNVSLFYYPGLQTPLSDATQRKPPLLLYSQFT
jgi:hypothetical protein